MRVLPGSGTTYPFLASFEPLMKVLRNRRARERKARLQLAAFQVASEIVASVVFLNHHIGGCIDTMPSIAL
jgi:hypothetical protein